MGTNNDMQKEPTNEEQEYEHGRRCGRLWVTNKKPAATVEELARLNKFYVGLGADAAQWFHRGVSAFTVAERIYFIIASDHDGSRRESKNFWEFAAWPNKINDLPDEFVEGFVAGALEAWDETKSRA